MGLKDKVDQAKETQALAKPSSTVLSIFQDSRIKTQLSAALGSNVALSADRLLVVALNECRRNPGLLDCTRESFVGALLTAAHLGLEVGGPLGHFYLVPFYNSKKQVREITPILGYKGMIVLARRSNEIEDVVAREVCANDRFEFAYGIEDRLVHVPADGERGAVVKFYGVARFTNGGHLVRVMSVAEVNKFRDRSKAKNDGPWVTDYVAMGGKTVIRRMAAYLPLTTEAATAIAEDEERELGLTPEGVLDLDALGFSNGAPPPQGRPGEQPSDSKGHVEQGESSAGSGSAPKDKRSATTPDSPTTTASSPGNTHVISPTPAAAVEGGGAETDKPGTSEAQASAAPVQPPSTAPPSTETVKPASEDPGAAFRR